MNTRRQLRLSNAIEDYLKAIYELQQRDDRVSTNALADQLGFAPASVTGMLKKLSTYEPPLVDYTRHRGVRLTSAGERIALEIVRHHRLIELYLVEALGYTWDEVHDEADRLEHVISEEFEDRIAAFLGYPETDPHGSPIPSKEGVAVKLPGQSLNTLHSGDSGRVVRVNDDDPALLRYVAELGMTPGAIVHVLERGPFDGPLQVRVGDGDPHALGPTVTANIFVELV